MNVTVCDGVVVVCSVCKSPLERRCDSIFCPRCRREFLQKSEKFINLLPEDKLQEKNFNSWQIRQGHFLGWNKKIMNEALASEVRSLYDEFSEYTGKIKGLTLDVGCADCKMNSYLKQTRYIGIDPYEGWILENRPAYMEKIYPIDKNNLVFIRGFGEYLPFGSGVFDNVIISNALDHSSSFYDMLEEAARVLKSSGGLYLMHEKPGLMNKIARKTLSRIYQSIKRRFKQYVLIGYFKSPHIKISEEELEKWLRRYFEFESKLSDKHPHIFYRSIKKSP